MIVRLYVKEKITNTGQVLTLDEKQSHYLGNVLRFANRDTFYAFDGCGGEYKAEFFKLSPQKAQAVIKEKVHEFVSSPDIWLLFAPLKKNNTDMVVQKATELGVSCIIPVITAYTNSGKVRTERFIAQSIEASEQCRRQDVPKINQECRLMELLQRWQPDRTLFFLNEHGKGKPILTAMRDSGNKAAVLVGPEGGFSAEEENLLLSYSFVRPVFLGKRILRAETAAVAALACWQAISGDWRG